MTKPELLRFHSKDGRILVNKEDLMNYSDGQLTLDVALGTKSEIKPSVAGISQEKKVVKEGKLAQKQRFEVEYIDELQKIKPEQFLLPDYLKPFENYPPTDEFTIKRGVTELRIRLYGQFKGHPFKREDIIRENIDSIICLHDASHSVDLFLSFMDQANTVALHSLVPFVFSTSLPYTLYYTQKYNYPLITTEVMIPVKQLLYDNLLPKTQTGKGGRWCTRVFKIEPSRVFYQAMGLKGITQLKGITRWQSSKRNKMYQGHSIDLVSSKTLLNKIQLEKHRYQILKTLADAEQTLPSISKLTGLMKKQIEKLLEILIAENKVTKQSDIYRINLDEAQSEIENEPKPSPEDLEKYFYVNQQLPIFEHTDEQIESNIKQHGIKRNPPEEIMIYKLFDWKKGEVVEERCHGCIMCPFRNKMWYYYLKYRFPKLYELCNQWRIWGSGKRTEAGGEEYFYFYDPTRPEVGDKIL